jgi:predicted phage baseplate assembly protein
LAQLDFLPKCDWFPRLDLLYSEPDAPHFVVEIDNAGVAHLRFGDDECGRAPEVGWQFMARYRVGNGLSGNVGADTLTHLVYRSQRLDGIESIRNPLPAQGGVDPEPINEVKLLAPMAFRQQLNRAVTVTDYARLAERHPAVQRAAAHLSWTGSWYEVRVVIDPIGGAEANASLLEEIEHNLQPFRRIGHEVRVLPARYVPVEIKLTICVKPGYLRSQVKAALQAVFSTRTLPNQKRGFFHPDNVTFGDGLYLSQLVAVAESVAGVESVVVSELKRQFEPSAREIVEGVLALNPLEIVRCDTDPNFPEHGRIEFNLHGGR